MGPIALLDRGTVTAAVVAAAASAAVVSVAFRLTPAPTVTVPPSVRITTVGTPGGPSPSTLAGHRIRIVVPRQPVVSFNDGGDHSGPSSDAKSGGGDVTATPTPTPSAPSGDGTTSDSGSSSSDGGDPGSSPSSDG